jgi:hypothetical protein
MTTYTTTPDVIHAVIINYLQPEDVLILKPYINIKVYKKYFTQDLEHIQVFNCKQKLVKKYLSNYKDEDFIENYITGLIQYGIMMGGDYNYIQKKMTNIDTCNSFEEIEDFLIDYDIKYVGIDGFSTDISNKAYTEFLIDKLQNINKVVLPNIAGLIIKNTTGFNTDKRCTREDKFSNRIMKKMYTDTYSLFKKSGITMYDLINGVWEVKSSKVDTNYEMFGTCYDIKILENYSENSNSDSSDDDSEENILYISVEFDHGS